MLCYLEGVVEHESVGDDVDEPRAPPHHNEWPLCWKATRLLKKANAGGRMGGGLGEGRAGVPHTVLFPERFAERFACKLSLSGVSNSDRNTSRLVLSGVQSGSVRGKISLIISRLQEDGANLFQLSLPFVPRTGK